MAKYNPTSRHFVERRPDSISIMPGALPVPLPYKMPLFPHCWNHPGPSSECSYDDFAASFATMPTDHRLFLDTGFITSHELPKHLLDHIVTKHIAITKGVWDELQPWVNNTRCNVAFRDYLVRAMEKEISGNGHSHVSLVSWRELPPEFVPAANYYIRLLGMRKYFGVHRFELFLSEHKREPTLAELQVICQQMSGARGWRIAKKAIENRHKPDGLVDESLVVNAVFHSILFGIPTVVLTRDTDVFEQFYKAIYLIGTHYTSMLMGARLHQRPEDFKTAELPKASGLYIGEGNLAVDMVAGKLGDLKDSTLRPIQCTCVLLSTSDKPLMFSERTHGLVEDMVRVLRIKSKTRGRNTDLFAEKNFHVSFDPRNVEGVNGPALINDNLTISSDADEFPIARTDIELAIFTDEQFAKLVFSFVE